jgi:hypothetical protein
VVTPRHTLAGPTLRRAQNPRSAARSCKESGRAKLSDDHMRVAERRRAKEPPAHDPHDRPVTPNPRRPWPRVARGCKPHVCRPKQMRRRPGEKPQGRRNGRSANLLRGRISPCSQRRSGIGWCSPHHLARLSQFALKGTELTRGAGQAVSRFNQAAGGDAFASPGSAGDVRFAAVYGPPIYRPAARCKGAARQSQPRRTRLVDGMPSNTMAVPIAARIGMLVTPSGG